MRALTGLGTALGLPHHCIPCAVHRWMKWLRERRSMCSGVLLSHLQ